jgi:hypothetical protein
MILLKSYESLEDVLKYIKLQIIESIPYAKSTLPRFTNPMELFYYLHDRVTYMSDPVTIELIMTMKTMMEGTRTGVPGAGDCDDFTITAAASLYAQGWEKMEIVLAGRTKAAPVHIYLRIRHDYDWYVFDLTEPEFNLERKYAYYQNLELIL